ncbi:unnamed protein product, partial [Dovyalis caffra]
MKAYWSPTSLQKNDVVVYLRHNILIWMVVIITPTVLEVCKKKRVHFFMSDGVSEARILLAGNVAATYFQISCQQIVQSYGWNSHAYFPPPLINALNQQKIFT